jgi:hypothetical protein
MNHWESPSYVVKVGEQRGFRGFLALHGSVKLLTGSLGGTQPSDDPFLVIQELKYKSRGCGRKPLWKETINRPFVESRINGNGQRSRL